MILLLTRFSVFSYAALSLVIVLIAFISGRKKR